MKPFLSIDPGLEYGWAYWSNPIAPKKASVFAPEDHPDYFVRAKETIASMTRMLRLLKVEEVVCEWPAFMDYDRGKVTARSGSLVKLSFMVGALAGLCYLHSVKFIPVEVNVWKGQLPKAQVNYHVERILGKVACRDFSRRKKDEHLWDAVGIGLHHLGRF